MRNKLLSLCLVFLLLAAFPLTAAAQELLQDIREKMEIGAMPLCE